MLSIGSIAPDFSGNDINPNVNVGTVKLSDFKGKVICLVFFDYYCWACQDELPRLQNLWKKFQGHGIQIMAVHKAQSQTDAVSLLSSLGITFPAIQDDSSNTIFDSYATGTISMPQLYIIDRDQKIFSTTPGGIDESYTEGDIVDAIAAHDPIDIEMVMDVSDSMNKIPSGGDSKLLMMKKSANIFIDFLGTHLQTQDRMGLVWFTDNANEMDYGGQKLFPLPSYLYTLKAEINALQTGVCTAMGAGLQLAFNTLSTSTQKHIAILLTDGMQNIEPKVTKVDNHYEIIDSGGNLCGAGHHSNVPAQPGVDITTYKTQVHAIGVGITANYEKLLQDIATETGGSYLGTNDPQTDLDLIYLVDFCNLLAGGSPSIVHYHAGVFDPQECQSIEVFRLNRSVRKITVVLSWEKSMAGSLAFWLRAPDGTLLDLHREMKLFDTYAMATVHLPKEQNGMMQPYVGEWQMIVRGEIDGNAAYHAMIVAEDPETHFVFDYPKKAFEVGDILPLRIRLKEAEKHLIRAKEIEIETSTLRVPVSELLAQYNVSTHQLEKRAKAVSKKNSPNLLELKLKALSVDPRFREWLLPVRKIFSLEEGTLDCRISDEDIIIPVSLTDPGLNTIRIKVDFETGDNGPISRISMVSVHVGHGKIDPQRSSIKAIPITKEKGKGALIRVTPRNAAGQMFGPGRTEELSGILGQKTTKFKVEDLLDGTYLIEIPPEKKLPPKGLPISLKFRDKTFWEGVIE